MSSAADVIYAWEQHAKMVARREQIFRMKYPVVIDAAAWNIWDQSQPPWEEPRHRLTEEVLDWFKENTQRPWNSHRALIGFVNDFEAIHFKLRWA